MMNVANCPTIQRTPPSWRKEIPDHDLDFLNVRKQEVSPFKDILDIAENMSAGQVFRLRISFEPQLVYRILLHKGFEYWVVSSSPAEWRIDFYKRPQNQRGGGEAGNTYSR